MSGRIIAIRSIALAAPLLVWGAGIGVPANIARADDCLAAPNSEAPKGSHWYYHTDRAKGRECWFLRKLDGTTRHMASRGRSATAPTTHAAAVKKPEIAPAGAPVSTSAGDNAPSLPPRKAQSAPTSSATTRNAVGQHIQEQSTAPLAPDATAPQASVWTQSSAKAPATAIVWPDPPKLATVTMQKPSPSNARPDTVGAAVDARASQNSEGAARGGAPTVRAVEMAASPAGMLVETSLVVALGLFVGGLLYRLVVKISAARSQRIIIDHSASEWIDDRRAQSRGFVKEREEFINDAHLSLVPVASDYGASRPTQGDDMRQNNGRPKGRAAQNTEQIMERENTLVQLLRDLDEMLQSREGA